MGKTNGDTARPSAAGADGKVPFEVFQALPKTDLHVHLDGSLRLETILDLARAGRHRAARRRRRRACARRSAAGKNFGSLVEYLRGFDITLRVMQTEEALERIAFELAEDAHRENVRYMEVRYSPMLHTRRGLRLTQGGRGGARRPAARARNLRHQGERHPVRHPQHLARDRRTRWPSSPSPTRAAAWSASTSPAPSTTIPAKHHRDGVPAGPRQQHQLHDPRRRGLRARIDRPGDPRLRRAPHRPRLPPARERRPAALRQRPPHPARVLPLDQRADRRGAATSRRTRSSSTSTSACA